MVGTISKSNQGTRMRLDAERRLREGTAPPNDGSTLGPDVLALLYRLASDPDSASDALRLLHELQAYQVEIDLQQGEIRASEQALAQELAWYKGFFHRAPEGYLIVGVDGRIMDANARGGGLLGAEHEGVNDRVLHGFLTPDSRSDLEALLEKLRNGEPEAACDVRAGYGDGTACWLRIAARPAPDGDAVLMTVSEAD